MKNFYWFICFVLNLCFISVFAKVSAPNVISDSVLHSKRDNAPAPVVSFTFTNDGLCSGTPVTFTPSVTGVAPFSYLWEFGDAKTSSLSNPSHVFTALGCGLQSFTVKLTVTDASGQAIMVSRVVTVKQKPDLSFVNLNAASGSSSSFEKCGDNNSDPTFTINVGNTSASVTCAGNYSVDWGDGSTENNVVFPKTHTYRRLGSFNMIITAKGTKDCENSVTYVVKNSNNPIGALIAPGNTTNFCLPVAPMNFAIGSWALNPSDTRYQVNYGDGTIVNYTQADLENSVFYNKANPIASQNFPIPHTFKRFNCPNGNTVALIISTSCGSTYLTAGPIIILDVPIVDFNVNRVNCVGRSVSFNNNTIAGYTNDCSTFNVYTWDFGDGSPISREVSPSHIYNNPGSYTITMFAQTPCGIGRTVTKTICVEPILQPNFTYSKPCANSNTQITNTTDVRQSCGTETYIWNVINYFEGFCGKRPEQWFFTSGTNRNSKNPVINFVTPGTYYLQLTTINSCGIERNNVQIIEVKTPPTITLNPISDFCNSATIQPVGTVVNSCAPQSELTYLWSFPGGTPSSSTLLNPGSITYAVSGNYQATFSVTNSCGTTTQTRNFSVNTVLSPIISPKTESICSESSFTVRPTSNGTDNVPTNTTYTWTNPVVSPAGAISGAIGQFSPVTSISQTLINTTSLPATVTYTINPISGSCPGPAFTITVTVNPLIRVIETIKKSTCFGTNDAEVSILVSGGIPFPTGAPYQFLWTGPEGFSANTGTITSLKPGFYTLRVIDNGNCPFVKSYFVEEPGKFQFNASKVDISCFNKNDGTIDLNVVGGNLPYSFEWTKDGVAFSLSEDLRNLESGTYAVTIKEANNCDILIGSYTVVNPPLLEVKLDSQVDILCYGFSTGAINITATGGRASEIAPGIFNYRYNWTGPNGFMSSNKNLSNIPAGTYNLVVTDNSNCTATLQVVLTQNDEIALEFKKTEIACYNDANASITITNIKGGIPFATGAPYQVQWSNLGTGLVQNNLSAGTYLITVTDALNCSKVFPVVIDNAPIFSINPDVKKISCFGAKDAHIRLNLVGGLAPVTLVWDDSPTAGVERNNIGPGRYTVTITDAKMCQIKETFIINEPLLLELKADVTNTLSCLDANTGAINLIVTGGAQPYRYAWSNGATTEDLQNLSPDNYTVVVTDANGCRETQSWKITRFEQLTPTVEVLTDYNCDTKFVKQTFLGRVKGGVPPYTLNWSDGVVTGNNNEIMNTSNNGLIIFNVTDSFGCTASTNFNVATPELGIANFETNSYANDVYQLYSIHDPIQFNNLATGDFTTIAWDFGDGNFSDQASPQHIYSKPGTYTIKQTVNYPFGCQFVYSKTLLVEKGYTVVMPTAFTPNGDGVNDSFNPVFLGFIEMTLDIYDTWGSIIYSEKGQTLSGWNGKVKDIDAENGNYYFKLTATIFYNKTVVQEGAFTLIK